MPILPDVDPPLATWCNLRQALRWLRDEERPIDSQFERALDEGRSFCEDDYRIEMRNLCGSLMKEMLPLYGCPGTGHFMDHRAGLAPIYQWPGYDDYRPTFDANGKICIWFDDYGPQETIPIEKIFSAGVRGFDVLASTLTHLELFDTNGNPKRAWQYAQVAISTADLLRVFPAATSKHPAASEPSAGLTDQQKKQKWKQLRESCTAEEIKEVGELRGSKNGHAVEETAVRSVAALIKLSVNLFGEGDAPAEDKMMEQCKAEISALNLLSLIRMARWSTKVIAKQRRNGGKPAHETR